MLVHIIYRSHHTVFAASVRYYRLYRNKIYSGTHESKVHYETGKTHRVRKVHPYYKASASTSET